MRITATTLLAYIIFGGTQYRSISQSILRTQTTVLIAFKIIEKFKFKIFSKVCIQQASKIIQM